VTAPPAPPLRSLLFVPGHRSGWIASAQRSGTDAILVDLQDAVPPGEIDRAREVVRAAVEELSGAPPAILARVSAVDSPALDADLDAVVRPGLAGIVLPMVETPADVQALGGRLDRLEASRGIAAGSTVIMPLVETALAARFAFEIARSSERVAYMGAGTAPEGDIARAIGFRWTPEGSETLLLRSWVLLNARAAGVPFPVSGLWPLVDDLVGLRAFAEQTRGLGYAGMTAIHPSHVPVINEVFTPTGDEIRRWRDVIGALDTAATGGGALRFGDTMIDAAHARTARLGLELARRLGVIPPEG
jgi:citrate lyase subunit beta/citryl-CoA lyase